MKCMLKSVCISPAVHKLYAWKCSKIKQNNLKLTPYSIPSLRLLFSDDCVAILYCSIRSFQLLIIVMQLCLVGCGEKLSSFGTNL